ncbi:MAG: PilZ domain-containing protein, partial [Bdellovibrionales bacterium]|nr:PilZ domain-containing protein [Bdellovibrionales bacterium]
NPQIRWWLVAERKYIKAPIGIAPFRGEQFVSRTLDISKTGAFIESQGVHHLNLGEKINLSLKLGTLQQLQLQAEVVRFQDEGEGFGVHFQEMNQQQRKILDRYLQTIH